MLGKHSREICIWQTFEVVNWQNRWHCNWQTSFIDFDRLLFPSTAFDRLIMGSIDFDRLQILEVFSIDRQDKNATIYFDRIWYQTIFIDRKLSLPLWKCQTYFNLLFTLTDCFMASIEIDRPIFDLVCNWQTFLLLWLQ